ncbi:MAG: transporter substrate-binding domain-containing protein, partial [Burkholderiaceae bacterium]|nr:transporter substrate-binding domain-containing protein [Burkholderiaceae bacterium]
MQFNVSEVKERHVYGWYSIPYRRELVSLFAREGEARHFSIQRLDDLTSHDWKVLVPYFGFYGQALEDALPQLQRHKLVYPYISSNQGVEMLYHNRADLLLGDFYSLRYAAKLAGLPELDMLRVPVNENAVHLLFSKRTVTQEDVATIDAAIQKLESEGELRRIEERYAVKGEVTGR